MLDARFLHFIFAKA